LNAIKVCSAICDVYPPKIKTFADIYGDPLEDIDKRERLGESLLQIMQRSGEILPHLASHCISNILKVLGQRNIRILASATVLVSFIGKNHCDALKPFIIQIFDTIKYFISELKPKVNNKDSDEYHAIREIRRAAVLALVEILRGGGGHWVDLNRLYSLQTLGQKLHYSDRDSVIRGHIGVMLEELEGLLGPNLSI
jgi:hypothetical protein